MDNISVSIRSHTLGNKWYTISRFQDYSVDIDLDTDADDFNFTMSNPDCIFSGLISTNDRIRVKIGKTGIVLGIVDSVIYKSSSSGSTIDIAGRDKISLLIDNDCRPFTKKNLKPADYINQKCSKFGIKYSNKKPIPLIKKYEVDTGQTEISVITDILNKSKQKLWYIYDTVYTGSWNMNGKVRWRFTRGVEKHNTGINIEEITLTEDIKDIISKKTIYGNQSDNDKVSGSSSLSMFSRRGIIKYKSESDNDIKTSSKLSKQAQIDILDELRDAYKIDIVVNSKDYIIMPNTVCKIIDRLIGIDCTMFIKSVQYNKGSDGSKCTIGCVPDARTLNKLKSTSSIITTLASTNESRLKSKIKSVLNKYSKKW